MSPLIKGLILGFSIAAPVGPIGLLCIQRSLSQGMRIGFLSGLGAATADAAYGAVAGFGLVAISSLLLEYRTPIRLCGAAFLLFLGLKVCLSKPPAKAAPGDSINPLAAFASTLFLTLTNPMTIISFTGIFAGAGFVSGQLDAFSASSLVLGVFLGSAAWWLILSTLAGALQTRFNQTLLRGVNFLSGSIILSFALWQLFWIGR